MARQRHSYNLDKPSTKAGKSSGSGVSGANTSDNGGDSNSVACNSGDVVQILQSLIKTSDITKDMTVGDLIATLSDDESDMK